MSDHDVLEEAGDLRVRLVHDESPHEPDGDVQAYVIEVRYTGYGAFVNLLHDRSMSLNLPDWVLDVLDSTVRYDNDWDAFDRCMAEENVHWDRIHWGDGCLLFVATPELRQAWGVAPERDTVENSVKDTMAEWQAYRDGEVYGYIVEERATWARVDIDHEDERRETWEEIDSCWGFYGYEYAEVAAREALEGARV